VKKLEHPLFLSLLSAILLILSFPNFSIWPLAFVAFVPVFYLTIRIPLFGSAFFHWTLFGFLFFLTSVEWLRHVTALGWTLMAFFFAVYFGLFGSVVHWFWSRGQLLRSLLALPSAWAVLEWIRTEIPIWGFGWNLLAYSQASNLGFAQFASWVGAYGVSWAIVLVNLAVFFLLRFLYLRSKPHALLALYSAGMSVFMLGFIFTHSDFPRKGLERQASLRVAVLQGNIPQGDKWNPNQRGVNLATHRELSRFVALDHPDLILWPEAAFPGYFNRDQDRKEIITLADELGIPILLGSLHLERSSSGREIAYNSATLIHPRSTSEERYDKIRLVPFGEFVPWPWLFRPFGLERLAYSLGVSDFYAGRSMHVFSLEPSARFSTLICFEDTFPSLARQAVDHGAEFLTVITNDAWFKESAAPYQHLQASQFRAIENGVAVVRAANTGVSAFVSSRGEVIDRIKDPRGNDLFVGGGLVRAISTQDSVTFYRRAGHWFPLACLAVLGFGCVGRRSRIDTSPRVG